MYLQAAIPNDFNPFTLAPSPAGRSPEPRSRRNPDSVVVRPPSKRALLVAVQVASWLAAPVGLAAFLLTH